MTSPAHTQAFEDAININPITSHTYSVNLHSDWAIGKAPHGGYVSAIFYRLAKTHFHRIHPAQHYGNAIPITMQLVFVRRSDIGRALLNVTDVKLGRRTSTVHVTLSQENQQKVKVVKLSAYITVSNIQKEAGLSLQPTLVPSNITLDFGPPRIDSIAFDNKSSPWQKVIIPHPEFRRAPCHVDLYRPVVGQQQDSQCQSVQDQWARLKWSEGGRLEQGRWSNEAVAFLLDVFPDTLARFERAVNSDPSKGNVPVWFPTLAFNIEFKKQLPSSGVEWLYSRVTVKSVSNGRLDIGVVLLDEQNEIVALANQVGLLLSAKSNDGNKHGGTTRGTERL